MLPSRATKRPLKNYSNLEYLQKDTIRPLLISADCYGLRSGEKLEPFALVYSTSAFIGSWLSRRFRVGLDACLMITDTVFLAAHMRHVTQSRRGMNGVEDSIVQTEVE
jgi:hypothetical protein